MVNLFKDCLEFVFFFVFSVVDFFVFWYIKEGGYEVKCYGVLFICLVFRVVYFEIVSSLFIDLFLNVYREFVGCRGSV